MPDCSGLDLLMTLIMTLFPIQHWIRTAMHSKNLNSKGLILNKYSAPYIYNRYFQTFSCQSIYIEHFAVCSASNPFMNLDEYKLIHKHHSYDEKQNQHKSSSPCICVCACFASWIKKIISLPALLLSCFHLCN